MGEQQWQPRRDDRGALLGYVRRHKGAQLAVSPLGVWSVHAPDGRRLACRPAVSAAAGMEAADDFAAERWGVPRKQEVE